MMNVISTTGKVFLVGAGPGDPGLLTLRAVECLQQADFVLHDYLSSPRTLSYARTGAELLCVDQLPGEHPQRWPAIHQRIIDEARKGKTVVRLKGGDPLIFGRGGEEAEALRQAGIPYEIVPGVSAALAAGAYAEIPLTHRAHASAVAFVTGHEHPGKATSRLDWDALAKFPGTLAMYMGVGRLGTIASELVARGKSPETPAALVHQASTGDQRTVVGTLATIENLVRHAGVTSPSLMVVGPVVALKPEMSWFETRPLLGVRVLITRPRPQADAFARKLELLGAVPDILPVLEIRPPNDWSPVDTAIEVLQAGGYDWLIWTSVNGVETFFDRLKMVGKDMRTLGRVKLAVVGSATARKLAEYHLKPDLMPTGEMRSEGLADALAEQVQGSRILLAQASQGRELLRDRLAASATVDSVIVYEQVDAVEKNHPLFDRLRRGEIHFVTLTSPNIAKAFLNACDKTILDRFRKGTTQLVVNSERLQVQLKDAGYSPICSANPTESALIDVILKEPKT